MDSAILLSFHTVLPRARNVESVLNTNPEDNSPDADSYFRERILWSLQVLRAYAEALKPVRESGITSNDSFGFGM